MNIEEQFNWMKQELREQLYSKHTVDIIPILHNHYHVFLLMNGCGIYLNNDGTWQFDNDTSGG